MLGSFGLFAGHETVPVPAMGQRLMALLALLPDGSTRGRVAGALWPDAGERQAAASLRSVLWRLRPLVQAGWMVVDPLALRLGVEVRVDLWEARDLARRILQHDELPDEPEWGPRTLALLADDLLPDWYDDWITADAEAWRQLRLHALEAQARALADAGRYAGAVEAGIAAAWAEPLRESAQTTLIRVHLAEGNRMEAKRHYDRYSKLLADELGVEPGVDLRGLVGDLVSR